MGKTKAKWIRLNYNDPDALTADKIQYSETKTIYQQLVDSSGDMEKTTYDSNNSGTVDTADNAILLNNELPSYYLDYSNFTNTPTLGTASSLNTGTTTGTIPIINGDNKLSASLLPAIVLTDVFTVATETAQLSLTAQEGDVAVRTDLSKSYIHNGGITGTMSDWTELLSPTGASVTSVDGRTGAVDLSDLYAPISVVGDVTKVGNPINKEIGVWTGDGTLGRYVGFEYNGSGVLTIPETTGSDYVGGQLILKGSTTPSVLNDFTIQNYNNSVRFLKGGATTMRLFSNRIAMYGTANDATNISYFSTNMSNGTTTGQIGELASSNQDMYIQSVYGNVRLEPDTGKSVIVEEGLSVNGTIQANSLISTVATGTPPFVVSSTTNVPNLNAGYLDGYNATAFLQSGATDTYSGGILYIQNDGNVSFETATSQINGIQVHQAGSGDAMMSFHISGIYACHFGLDATTHRLSVGGWSMGANSYSIFHDNYHPNADKLTTARTISLTGDVTGSTSFDGSGNVSINCTATGGSGEGFDSVITKKIAEAQASKVTSITYNGDDTVNVITYNYNPGSGAVSETYTYNSGKIATVVWKEGTTTLRTDTYNYTNGLLTSIS